MKKKIAVLPGDGIGPEIIAQAVAVLDAVAEKYGHQFTYEYARIGACAIDSCGDPYPQETHEKCMNCDAILFGSIGDPKYDNDPSAKVRPEQGLLRMRKNLGLYANIRPVKPYDTLLDASPLKNDRVAGSDFIVVRELTGGIYFGEPRGRDESGDKAFDSCVYSKEEIERVSHIAFQYALRRRKKVTLVDKANVLATSRLWRETVKHIHQSCYPQVSLEFMFVDNAAMKMVSNPKDFDVILTENMFGDILSDISGVINGSIGLLPSASFGRDRSLFEPIHGSYPQAAGKDIANPIATILSAAMMLEDAFGLLQEAQAVKDACAKAIADGICTEDIVPGSRYGTVATGQYIIDMIKA